MVVLTDLVHCLYLAIIIRVSIAHPRRPNSPIVDRAKCVCTPTSLQCCRRVFQRILEGYGRKQYRVHNRTMYEYSRSSNADLTYYMCENGTCTFYNMADDNGDAGVGDGGERTAERGRSKRSVVDTCCGVVTSIVEVIEVINIEDDDDIWFTFTDDNNRGPTFVVRTCADPSTACGEENDGQCETILDVHGVLVYRVNNGIIEYNYVPVTFDVGCECRSVPNTGSVSGPV